MGKKQKTNLDLKISSIENTKAHMPHYNAYQGGYGAHGDEKYNRRKEKKELRRMLNEVL